MGGEAGSVGRARILVGRRHRILSVGEDSDFVGEMARGGRSCAGAAGVVLIPAERRGHRIRDVGKMYRGGR